DKKLAANWIMTTLLGLLNTKGISINESPVTAGDFSKLLVLMEQGTITATAGKSVFEEMVISSKAPDVIVREKGLEQVSDQSQLNTLVQVIIRDNPAEVAAYREGKTKLFSFFMGQIMKKTRGKADPAIVTQLLKTNL
ncbi:MAG: Asp-tRNA(Asn)/Glu-tRNA(Gln) amidotransferase GatCAB subunit B, partial [Desulfobacula sp.]|nr:Asp-tRNA(Asn)/Glu-tRNA(Gln) amidotransferase GatCAB subunit B [Desulfobacula sp.]